MTRTRVGALGRGAVASLAVAGALLSVGAPVTAHPPQNSAEEPVTRFEQFLLGDCSPCVRESFPIATLPVPSVKLPASSRNVSVHTTRRGEIGVDVLRSHLLGRPSRQLWAIRLTLSVATGAPGELYRMAAGIVDEADVPAFVSGVSEIVQAMSAPTPPGAGADTVDIDQSGGTVRVGVARLGGESMVYVQAGDPRVLTRRPVWEASSTVYLPVADLSALRDAIAQAAAKIQQMRSAL